MNLYSFEQCIRKIDAIVAANPKLRNPRSPGGTCLYYKREYKLTESERCIIGALAHEFGFPAPALNESCGAHIAAEKYDWPISDDTAYMLRNIQLQFDRTSFDNSLDTWEVAWSRCKREVPAVQRVFPASAESPLLMAPA